MHHMKLYDTRFDVIKIYIYDDEVLCVYVFVCVQHV